MNRTRAPPWAPRPPPGAPGPEASPAPGLVPGDIQAEFRVAVPLDRAELGSVHQLQAGFPGLVEQRPEPAGLPSGQLDRPLVAAGVVVSLVGMGPVQGKQLSQQSDLRA